MKNLILVSLFGKFKAFIENNGKIEVFDEEPDSKYYSTIKFNGPKGVSIKSDEIPYSNGNRSLDDISYSFGSPTIPMMDIGINIAQILGKKIDAIYFISEKTNSKNFDAYIKGVFKKILNRDIYKGTVGFLEIVHSIGKIYTMKENKTIQILSPNFAYIATANIKHRYIDSDVVPGIALAEGLSDLELLNEFEKRFKNHLNLFEEKKNLMILRGMYLAGFYGYIYEHKEEDVVNIYQDRRITLPFEEIKSFIDDVHIPRYKKLFSTDDIIYSVNIPGFNAFFKDENIDDRFIMSQEDFMLYGKMLLDFNNDISIKAYRLKTSDFIYVFGNSIYGRKSSEFFDKQLKFIFKAFKDNQKKE